MQTTVHTIAPGIHRISTFVPQVAPPAGFSFNQFLIEAESPLLFHCGMRSLFPQVREAVESIVPLERLRWISFGHVEADECGAMNQWLAAAPQASVAHGALGCDVSLNDLADRAPRPLQDGETLDLGGRRVRFLATPHVPHGWDAGVLFEETTNTLLCGDLFTHLGDGPALIDEGVVEKAMEAEDLFQATAITPLTAPTLRRLAGLSPRVLAIMHGSSYAGDGARALQSLADCYERRLGRSAAR